MQTGLIRNNTDILQSFGNYTIPARSIGRVPSAVIDGLRKHPNALFTVVADDPEAQWFRRTETMPSNPRYQLRLKE